jgi:rhodanese-related sulfurtransferase
MILKRFVLSACLLCAWSLLVTAGNPSKTEAVESPTVQFISVDELKTRVVKKQPVTIIDVRATDSFADSERKIKGAIHVKLRRLRYRLSFAPLSGVGHNSEIVTYCACPNDELSIKAAQVLMDSGFTRVRILKGGWHAWLKLNGPVEHVAKGM